MITGQIILNGVSDEGTILIIQAKSQHLGISQLQPVEIGGTPPTRGFNATLVWNDHDGFKTLAEVIQKLAALAP